MRCSASCRFVFRQLDSRPSPRACSKPLSTGQRPLGACVIAALLSESAEVMDAHNVLSVRHWDRIGRGLLHAATSAVPWAILHARTFDQDVLLCGRCGGRLRVRAVIVDPEVAEHILASLSVVRAGFKPARTVARGPPSGQLDAAW